MRDGLESKQSLLRNILPFRSLNEPEIEEIARMMEWTTFSPGSHVIRQGAPGAHFYLIISGLVKVFLEEDGKETVLGFLGEGECFGEVSLLTQGPTTANVHTVEHTLCLVQKDRRFSCHDREAPVLSSVLQSASHPTIEVGVQRTPV